MVRRSAPRHVFGVGIVCAVALIAAACSSDDTSSPSPSSSPSDVDVTTPPDRESNGELTIGVLLPRSGAGGSLGEPLIEIIQSTVGIINAEGGVLDRPIELAVRDEGTDRTSAEVAVAELLNLGVDAIIGPGSSNIAVAVAPTIVNAGILACSPLATSLLLSDVPDDGLVIRTVPGDNLQAEAIARTIDGTGFREVVLVAPDDLYGRTFGDATRDALESRGLSVQSELSYSAESGDFTDIASDIVAEEPSVVAIIGTSDNGVRLVTALETAVAGGVLPLIVANDTMRNADLTPLITGGSLAYTRVSGVSVEPFSGALEIRSLLTLSNDQPTPAFAAAAIDCLNIIALTASQAGRDVPREMASLVQATTSGGTVCVSYASCAVLLAQGRDISYDGPTRLLTLDAAGDPTVGEFLAYAFDAAGEDVTTGRVVVGTE